MPQPVGHISLLDEQGRVLHSEHDGSLSVIDPPTPIGASERWLLHRVDGHYVALQSSLTDLWLCAEDSGRAVADRAECREWEQWRLNKAASAGIALVSHHSRYLAARPTGQVNANALSPSSWQLMWLPKEPDGPNSAAAVASPITAAGLNAEV